MNLQDTSDVDEAFDEIAHASLLKDLQKLDGTTQKINKEKVVRVTSNFTPSLNVKDILKKIGDEKLITTSNKLKALPKPLEKPSAKRLKRAAGYEDVVVDVNKWEGIVDQRRKAEQLQFPLEKVDLRVVTSERNYKPQLKTNLEKEVYLLLSGAKLTEEKKETEEEKAVKKAMSLKEIRMKSKEMWKAKLLRHRLEKKASMINKSKSRKYHKVLRRERVRKLKQEFERLKETKPEEALQILDTIEKGRVEERMNLRHRQSKWLKIQRSRAAQDPASRDALKESEDMRKELLEKVNKKKSPNSDDEEIDHQKIMQEQEKAIESGRLDLSNAWVSQLARPRKEEKEDLDFLKLKRFWEDVHERKMVEIEAMKVVEEKEKLKESTSSEVKLNPNKQVLNQDLTSITCLEDMEESSKKKKIKNIKKKKNKLKVKKSIDQITEFMDETENEQVLTGTAKKRKLNTSTKTAKSDKTTDVINDESEEVFETKSISNKKCRLKSKLVKETEDLKSESVKKLKLKSPGKAMSQNGNIKTKVKTAKKTDAKSDLKLKKKKKQDTNFLEIEETLKNPAKVCNVKKKKEKQTEMVGVNSKSVKRIKKDKLSSDIDQDASKTIAKIKPSENKKLKTDSKLKKKTVKSFLPEIDIDNIFDEAEEKMSKKTAKKLLLVEKKLDDLQKLSEKNNKEREKKTKLNKKSEIKTKSYETELEFDFTSTKSQSNIDETVNRARTVEDLENLNNVSEDPIKLKDSALKFTETKQEKEPAQPQEKLTVDIDEVKKIQSRPLGNSKPDYSHLRRIQGPDSESEDDGFEELFDDDENIKEFRAEKEEHEKKLEGQEIDMYLHGWGSWGGPGIVPSKNKRSKFKIRVSPPAKNKYATVGNVIYDESKDVHSNIRNIMVSELPYPFKSVKDFEASIRQPIGRKFVPEASHNKLTAPAVVTKMGAVIRPIGEEALLQYHDQRTKTTKSKVESELDEQLGKRRRKKPKNNKNGPRKPTVKRLIINR